MAVSKIRTGLIIEDNPYDVQRIQETLSALAQSRNEVILTVVARTEQERSQWLTLSQICLSRFGKPLFDFEVVDINLHDLHDSSPTTEEMVKQIQEIYNQAIRPIAFTNYVPQEVEDAIAQQGGETIYKSRKGYQDLEDQVDESLNQSSVTGRSFGDAAIEVLALVQRWPIFFQWLFITIISFPLIGIGIAFLKKTLGGEGD